VFLAYDNMAPALLERGDLDTAEQAIREARAGFIRGLGSANSVLIFLALLKQRRGDAELAARLVGAADRGYRDSGEAMHPSEARAREHLLDRLGHALGRERLTGLLREGEDWNEDQAFERAGFGRQAA
jgi:hypothetical protein